jgi:hypothetical protein
MAETEIISHLPGRLRFRGPSLHGPRYSEAIQAELRSWDDIIAVDGNPAAGSILVRYDKAQIPPEEMESRVAARFNTSTAPETSTSLPQANPVLSLRRINRPAKIGMLISLTASLLALSRGRKLHAVFGVMHLTFLAAHLLNHRNKLVQ